MTVAVQLEFRGATLEQYDEINERMGLLPGGPAAMPQEFSHWVTKTDDGFRVTDVWETREAFEIFAQRLRPVVEEVGIARQPEIQFFEVHNYLGGGRWRA
jgi:hypothetical protein